ncbi:MAG: flippase-like domain-containing protein [Ruminococcus flavefaciens]|nr:flippase-like domain-containing protein [Ruminococcus flavefaciens]
MNQAEGQDLSAENSTQEALPESDISKEPSPAEKGGYEVSPERIDDKGEELTLAEIRDGAAEAKIAQAEASPEEVEKLRKKKKTKKIVWNVLLVASIALGIGSMFLIVNEMPSSNMSAAELFSNIDPLFAVLFVVLILVVMGADTAKYLIINKTVLGKCRPREAFKTNFLGKYYDAVTPFGTGGQPMQIYYLSSKGISGGNASAIPMIKYYASVVVWVIMGAAFMIAGTATGVFDLVKVSETNEAAVKLLQVTGWVGIGINLIIPLFVTMFLLLPKAMHKLTAGVVHIGKKMRIVKDEEKTCAKALKIVDDFKTSFKTMATTPLNLIALILVTIIEVGGTFAVPFFVMKAFSCPVDELILPVLALNAFATFGSSFIPTPGNSGAVENIGAIAFSLVAGGAVAWSVLIWRFGVYYIYIIIGIIITLRDVIKKNIRQRKKKRLQSDVKRD